MPEGYTHIRVARKAAAAVRYKIKCPAAFAAGANGPDLFFCFEVWKKAAKRRYDLPALGTRMHEEKTGPFLLNLFDHAHTVAQVEFTLGFLCHYATDTTLHPYVAALCQPGQPYAMPGGHGYFEIALDSTLHAEDTGDARVPAADAAPMPTGSALVELTELLHACLQEVYDLDVSQEALADSFYYTNLVRRVFPSRFGVRKVLFRLLDPLFGGPGAITGHVSPRRLAEPLPDTWTDPYGGEAKTGDAFTLLAEAQALSERYMAAAILVWTGRQPRAVLAELLGSRSYGEGRATPRSDPRLPPPPEKTPASAETSASEEAGPAGAGEDLPPTEEPAAPEETAAPEPESLSQVSSAPEQNAAISQDRSADEGEPVLAR